MALPPSRPLLWHPAVETICALIPAGEEVYLVGGVVRDAWLQRPLRDIDLATPDDGRPLARRIANALHGAYYSLDPERGVGRALIPWEGAQLVVDVAQFRGPDLLTDLQKRDFTLNAMAVRVAGDLQTVIDPLGGQHDLAQKRLRQCSSTSIADDPVRALRAVRASLAFGLTIEPATRESIRQAGPRLGTTSTERVRDEFFNLLDARHPAGALRALKQLGLLAQIIPQTEAMQHVAQSPPHEFDLWNHTLAVIEHLDVILEIISPTRSPDLTTNIQLGLAAFALDPLRPALQEHLAHEWANGRSHHALLMLAALLHDSGKPAVRAVRQGRIRFWGHDQVGAEIAETVAQTLRLSNDELARLVAIVRHHMRPLLLHNGPAISARATYRFWRDTGPAGVDVCLLSLADQLGTYGPRLDHTEWQAYLDSVRALLDSYYFRRETAVAPPALLTGQDLIQHFDLVPGPQIGSLLERLREAQVMGKITTQKEALDWVQRVLGKIS